MNDLFGENYSIKNVRICLDTPPLANSPFEACDEISLKFYLAVCAQLFLYDNRTKLNVKSACVHYERDCQGLNYVFRLSSNLHSVSGQHLSAQSFLKGLIAARISRTPVLHRLRNIKQVYATDINSHEQILTVDLLKSDYLLPSKLAHCCFSALIRKETAEGLDLGGTVLWKKRSNREGTLVLNNNYNHLKHSRKIPNIDYVIESCPERMIRRFRSREIQATCPSLNSIATFKEILDDPLSRSYPSNLFFSLFPISNFFANQENRFDLWSRLNPYDIQKKMGPIMGSAEIFQTPFNMPALIQQRIIRRKLDSRKELTLAFNDYAPNGELVDIVKCQLEHSGLKVILVKDRFERLSERCDLRLVIFSNSEAYPVDVFGMISRLPLIGSRLITKEDYYTALDSYDGAPDELGRKKAFLRLQELFFEELPILVLGKFNQIGLLDPELSWFDFGSDTSWGRMGKL